MERPDFHPRCKITWASCLGYYFKLNEWIIFRELSSVFARLSRQVDQAKSDLVEEIKQLDKECEQLEEIGNKAKILK
jgi:hypothetical protein